MNGMRKGRGKGRISNNLVAASCAAVLTIYAAGYWRTRDAARQFAAQSKARRLPARTEPPALAPLIHPESPTVIVPSMATSAGRSSSVAARRVTHAHKGTMTASVVSPAAGPSSSLGATPQSTAAPPSGEGGIVVAPIPMPSEIAPVARSAPEPAAAPSARWRDGIYRGHGDSPHGDLDVRVVIREGRIVEAAIENCNTRYPCELINPLVQQAIVIQSSNVDYVSRATESSQAYNDGLVEALNKALYPPSGAASP
jgi:uncharacterized protein with FMN-binding domain